VTGPSPPRPVGPAADPAAPPGRFTVDPWDPGYGLAVSDELGGGALAESSAELGLDLELPADGWHPVDPDLAPCLPGTVLFLDGVRRIDARIWVHGHAENGGSQPARASPRRSPPASWPAPAPRGVTGGRPTGLLAPASPR